MHLIIFMIIHYYMWTFLFFKNYNEYYFGKMSFSYPSFVFNVRYLLQFFCLNLQYAFGKCEQVNFSFFMLFCWVTEKSQKCRFSNSLYLNFTFKISNQSTKYYHIRNHSLSNHTFINWHLRYNLKIVLNTTYNQGATDI